MGEGSTDRTIPRFAIIPTRDRPDVLQRCLGAIQPQVDFTVIIDNSDIGQKLCATPPYAIVHVPTQPPNLSGMWNRGLRWISEFGGLSQRGNRFDVAILNDDAIVPPGWFGAVSDAMRAYGAKAACSDPDGTLRSPVHHRKIGPVGLDRRLVGYAFILAGEENITADETLHWYFTDDHIDYEARLAGGTVMIPGFSVQHLYPNGQMTPELSERIAVDAANFKDRWGVMPW